MGLNKKGIFFSMDALIALSVILVGILVVFPIINSNTKETYSQRDLILSLTSLKVGEINNTIMSSLIANGYVKDLNKTVLEEIGELYVTNDSAARSLADSILSVINNGENIGIWFGDVLIASKNTSSMDNASNVISQTQKISGIRAGGSITAYSGRAYLTNSFQEKYFYFGGYVGEGNISARVEYSGNVSYAEMELATTSNFSVYVNGMYQANFTGSNSLIVPKNFIIPITDFHTGLNLVELRSNKIISIAGGFIRVSYKPDVSYYNQTKKKYLPGIEGAVNLYDGFYVPGKLNTLKIFLSHNNSVDITMRIGSTVVYNSNTSGVPQNITINNTYLSSILNYSNISEKTIPFRFGLANASYLVNISLPADVVSAVDLSGSMAPTPSSCSLNSGCCKGGVCAHNETKCISCGGIFTPAEDKIGTAKNATKVFVAKVLNDSDNRVGLVGYNTSVLVTATHNLSTNQTSLNATVNNWKEGGNTCICCGINSGISMLVNNSPSTSFRSIVIMSDGIANVQCPQQPNNNTAILDAIQAACDAYNKYGIIVYAVGFGSDADESALQSMASCGGGNYYFGSVDSLVSIYNIIAQEIIDASFHEQTLNVSGGYSSRLYPESYIEYNYNETTIPFGIITTTEKLFDNDLGGRFSLPANSSILETSVISYSGSRWTNELKINGIEVYNLTKYGKEYLDLGDPYSINIPNSYVNISNTVNLTTGLKDVNSSGGSIYDKIIYTIWQKDVAAFSKLSGSANGCNWSIMFSDGKKSSILVPSTYTGSEFCYYDNTTQSVSNTDDALQSAVLRLFKLLDYDSDGKIDVGFSNQDLEISSSQISGIPFDWSTEMQVRVWS